MARRLSALPALTLLAGGPAWSQGLPGDPEQGRQIAQSWCRACHEVAPGERAPSGTKAPPFQVVADGTAVTEAALRAFFQTPHATMPNVQPTRQETDDLIAYLLSLKGRQPGL
jgi:mono/diheme cytochrome c family protein